jgi:hypothetical protein
MGNRLYVVEMHTGRRWEPTVGVSLTREAGRTELARWRTDNVGRFRLTRYFLTEVLTTDRGSRHSGGRNSDG